MHVNRAQSLSYSQITLCKGGHHKNYLVSYNPNLIRKKSITIKIDRYWRDVKANIKTMQRQNQIPQWKNIFTVVQQLQADLTKLELTTYQQRGSMDLYDYIKSQPFNALPQEQIKKQKTRICVLLIQICLYMHSKKIAHYDIKAGNILLFFDQSNQIKCLKLCDVETVEEPLQNFRKKCTTPHQKDPQQLQDIIKMYLKTFQRQTFTIGLQLYFIASEGKTAYPCQEKPEGVTEVQFIQKMIEDRKTYNIDYSQLKRTDDNLIDLIKNMINKLPDYKNLQNIAQSTLYHSLKGSIEGYQLPDLNQIPINNNKEELRIKEIKKKMVQMIFLNYSADIKGACSFIKSIDKDRNKQISAIQFKEKFTKLQKNKKQTINNRQIQDVFNNLDSDNSDIISRSEVLKLFEQCFDRRQLKELHRLLQNILIQEETNQNINSNV